MSFGSWAVGTAAQGSLVRICKVRVRVLERREKEEEKEKKQGFHQDRHGYRRGRRYPGSAFSTSLIQLSTLESVVSLFAFRRTRLFCFLQFCFIRMLRGLSQHPSQCYRGFIDSQSVIIESFIYVSTELRKSGQEFAWGQHWSSSVGHVQGVGSGSDTKFRTYRCHLRGLTTVHGLAIQKVAKA
ncbi:hypothetical protein MTR67_016325 [Solanum verrucosum]|uniref:Uncharacterized protein n=1 Tax=Solanum verrucosum TaxID=315347 RepID=A0AAF0QIH6_SOLVR|nr:hypothetical protein MTR67_016325 [Solanum verrucosum]